jgi:nucleoid DNA-binding protein
MKPGDTVQTYHVRQVQYYVMHSRELRSHIAANSLVSEGIFEMVMDVLQKEIAEQLLDGKGVHLDGIGRFSLQIGTIKEKDEQGKWRAKVYTKPSQLTARELVVEGVTFVPDKEMLDRLKTDEHHFVCDKGSYKLDIPRAKLLATLDDYCAQHGSFSRRNFQTLFGVSRYKADQLLNDLVSEPSPQYYRQKHGSSWVYRKSGT